jgi:polysaccharide export outer membrane protein
MWIRASGWAVMAGAMVFGGCAHPPAVKTKAPVVEQFKIGREDVVEVSVWRDPELTRTVPVRPDGYISLPLAGEVMAAGKTPSELAQEIKKKLTAYVQDPRVTVVMREVNSSRVFVTGEVHHPGAFPIRGRISVLQAIALAGGFSDFADSNGIVVIRPGPTPERIPVRYSDVLNARADVDLLPGDTVVVP